MNHHLHLSTMEGLAKIVTPKMLLTINILEILWHCPFLAGS